MPVERAEPKALTHEGIAAYSQAIRHLSKAQRPWPPSDVLQCLLLRDAIARRYATGELFDGREAEEILAADAALSELAPRFAEIDEIATWRERFSPPPSAWWWHCDGRQRGLQRLDGLWNSLTLVLVATAISFATDLARRFSFESIDLWGELVVVLSALLAALSGGSILSLSLRKRLNEIFALVKLPVTWRGSFSLLLAAVFFAAVAGIWFQRSPISRHYNDLGALAIQVGRIADAEGALQRAVRLDPSNALAHYNLGSVCEDLFQPERAKTHYLIAFAAGEIRASNNLGRLFLLEGKPDQAVEVLLRAAEEARDRSDAVEIDTRYDILKNLGWARLEQTRFREARDYLNEAVQIRPEEAVAHCLLGRLYTVWSQPDLARVEWEGCLGADPRVREQDRWLGDAKAFLSQQDVGGAR